MAAPNSPMMSFVAGVSGNSLLPYKFLRISQEFVRQKGIPAHPWAMSDYRWLGLVMGGYGWLWVVTGGFSG